VQGAMRLDKPDAIELEYIQLMMMWLLFCEQPRHVEQLGLGSAALTKFCYRRLPGACVTAVELNPNVIAICRALFELPSDDARLSVRQMNALDFVLDPANRNQVDVLQVDLYDEQARGPVLDTPEFYQACFDSLSEDGIMTTNVFGDFDNYDKNLRRWSRCSTRWCGGPKCTTRISWSSRSSARRRSTSACCTNGQARSSAP
jgi:spermidine synthase